MHRQTPSTKIKKSATAFGKKWSSNNLPNIPVSHTKTHQRGCKSPHLVWYSWNQIASLSAAPLPSPGLSWSVLPLPGRSEIYDLAVGSSWLGEPRRQLPWRTPSWAWSSGRGTETKTKVCTCAHLPHICVNWDQLVSKVRWKQNMTFNIILAQ